MADRFDVGWVTSVFSHYCVESAGELSSRRSALGTKFKQVILAQFPRKVKAVLSASVLVTHHLQSLRVLWEINKNSNIGEKYRRTERETIHFFLNKSARFRFFSWTPTTLRRRNREIGTTNLIRSSLFWCLDQWNLCICVCWPHGSMAFLPY